MIGKKNIVFGFLYLVLTASLGPYMIVKMAPDVGQAELGKQKHVGAVQQMAENDFENADTMEPMTAIEIAKKNTQGILALSALEGERKLFNEMKGGPHAHGNLEAVLNIVAGLTLCFLAAPLMVKQVISWLFITGAILHSGMLYLLAFGVPYAATLLQAGPVLVLLALLVLGVASFKWLRPEVIRD